MPAGATAVGNPARIIQASADAQREEAAAKMGFSAYGVTQGDDPVAQAMKGLIDNAAGHEHQIALLWQTRPLRRERMQVRDEVGIALAWLRDVFLPTLPRLYALSQLGVRLAIDDFGTGYSSLARLRTLPIHVLKIDRSFVRDITTDPNDASIISAIIAMAHNLQLKVIAEGVETVAHGTQLLQLGCELAQGYGIARPMPAEAFLPWTHSWGPPHEWDELPWLGGLGSSDEAA